MRKHNQPQEHATHVTAAYHRSDRVSIGRVARSAHTDSPRGRPEDVGHGDRTRGARVDRSPSGTSRRGQPPARRPQRVSADADDPDRSWRRRGAQAARPRPTRWRRARVVHFQDPAAVPAAHEGDRGADSLAVPQGDQHWRLPGSSPVSARAGWRRAVGDDRHPTDRNLARRVCRVVAAIARGQGVRVRLGRRDLLQHPARGRVEQEAVHPRADGRDGRRQEGAHRGPGWIPGVRAVVARAAA